MKKRGFTLAEVLITLGIIGVIAALVIPQFVAGVHNQSNASKLSPIVADYENIFGMMMMKENTEDIYQTQMGVALNGDLTNIESRMRTAIERYTTISRTGTSTSALGYLAYNIDSMLIPAAFAEDYNCGCPESDITCNEKCDCVKAGNTWDIVTETCSADSSGGDTDPCATACSSADKYTCQKCRCEHTEGMYWDDEDHKCKSNETPSEPCANECENGVLSEACQSCKCEYEGGTWTDGKCDMSGGSGVGGGEDPNTPGDDPNTPGEDDPDAPPSTGDNEVIKTINGQSSDFAFKFGASTPGGANIFFGDAIGANSTNESTKGLSTVFIDVNGAAAPNKYGRDVFAFVLSHDGHLLPYGSEQAAKALGWTTESDVSARTWRGNNETFGCSNIGSVGGMGCTARLIENNYKVNY